MGTTMIIAVLVVWGGFGVVIVILHLFAKREIRQELETLAASVCPACGKAYGIETAEQALLEHGQRRLEVQKANPHLRINFVHYWDVQCPNCQAAAQFYYEKRNVVINKA